MHATERWFGVPGKIAVIFGATPIGVAAAHLLEEAGAQVLLWPTDREDPARGIDPEAEEAVARALDTAIARHGRIDIMVYAAGMPGAYPFASTTLDQWDRLHAINLRGAFVVLRETVGRMAAAGGGRIVAVSTMGALHPVLNGNAAYGASKAGLNALVRAVALDHAKDDIHVNAILPGAVPVGPMPADAPAPTGPAREPGRLMLGTASAEEMAAAILFLVSPAGRFMTGQMLTLDGGFLLS